MHINVIPYPSGFDRGRYHGKIPQVLQNCLSRCVSSLSCTDIHYINMQDLLTASLFWFPIDTMWSPPPMALPYPSESCPLVQSRAHCLACDNRYSCTARPSACLDPPRIFPVFCHNGTGPYIRKGIGHLSWWWCSFCRTAMMRCMVEFCDSLRWTSLGLFPGSSSVLHAASSSS